jgi:hypothetical protein
MNKKQYLLTILTVLFLSESAAFADNSSVEQVQTSDRMKNRLGTYLGVAEPAPGLLGANVAYNVTDFLKASLGFGRISITSGTAEASATTVGAGVRALVPGWNVTPTAGLHYGHVFYSGTGMLAAGGFDQSGGHVYGSVGVDWQTPGGFNLNGGLRQSFRSGVGGGIYLGIGKYVNWL